MPRASRHFLRNHVWHITYRCYERAFLLRFARDRQCWRRWLFEARKRYGLCVLDYMVTSNHIHLLVRDRGDGEIARSMQLIAGRTGQAYNQRKQRQGAYWEDRYHATAVDTERHVAQCLVYVDLNMVRAGVVGHPREWAASGYREIQAPPKRYRIIDRVALLELFGVAKWSELQQTHAQWVEAALADGGLGRASCWSEAAAVGGAAFVAGVKTALGLTGRHRVASPADEVDGYSLREPAVGYGPHSGHEMGALSLENTIFWE
jgi:putative transposase